MSKINVRPYIKTDKDMVLSMINELQEQQRKLDKDLAHGKIIKDEYLKNLLKLTKDDNGAFYILEVDLEIAGFAVCFIEKEKIVSKIKRYGLLADMFILKQFRGLGLSKKLDKARIQFFKSKKIKYVKRHILAKNQLMHQIALNRGFKEYEITLVKKI